MLYFAVIFPPLLALSLGPSVTMLNHLLCGLLWGFALVRLGPGRRFQHLGRAGWQVACAFVLLGLGLIWSWHQGLPSSLSLTGLGLAGSGLLVFWAAIGARQRSAAGEDAFEDFASAMLIAGLVSAGIGLLQVFAPAWTDGQVLAKTSLVGRAVGNLRQPNHLSSLLIWALVALVPLAQRRVWMREALSRELAAALGVLLVWCVVLTASRTGLLGVLLLAVWGLVDRRLDKSVRAGLLASPVVYLLFWALMAAWAHHTQHTFGGEARLAEQDLSASRFGIWSNAWALFVQQPWTGVGLGNFNFAWTLTPFPGRPVAFFDHSHNVVLQLLVEMGLPLGGLTLALLTWGLVQAGRRAWQCEGEQAVGARSAFMMVVLIGLHSLLEYPLWYTYFLLPACWAWGMAVGVQPQGQGASSALSDGATAGRSWALPVAGAVMAVASVLTMVDYFKVVDIYAPFGREASLPDRIAVGQQSVMYRYQADYAAVTTVPAAYLTPEAFDHTTHALLDARLMMAWINALAAQGQEDKARYVAARLKEFRNPSAKAFFAACTADPAQPPPIQCQPPQQAWSWRDFMPKR